MKRIKLIALICFSGLAAYFGAPLMDENPDAIVVIVTVITVFAGFLVAIIAVLGDPAMVPEGSWHKAELRHSSLEALVRRHTVLFYAYLLALGLLFFWVLLRKEPDAIVAHWVKQSVEYVLLFFAILS